MAWGNKITKRKCKYCGEEFETYSRNKIYCSRKCKDNYYKEHNI